jgi:hypothetical protein
MIRPRDVMRTYDGCGTFICTEDMFLAQPLPPNKLPKPHLLEQFVFGHNPAAVRQQVGQDVAFLGP